MQAHANTMKGTWASTRGGGKKVKLSGEKKRSADSKEMNTIVASAVAKTTQIKNKPKSKYTYEPEDDNKAKQFNFKHIGIGSDREWEQNHKENILTGSWTIFDL